VDTVQPITVKVLLKKPQIASNHAVDIYVSHYSNAVFFLQREIWQLRRLSSRTSSLNLNIFNTSKCHRWVYKYCYNVTRVTSVDISTGRLLYTFVLLTSAAFPVFLSSSACYRMIFRSRHLTSSTTDNTQNQYKIVSFMQYATLHVSTLYYYWHS
jgi:hypothetical protein